MERVLPNERRASTSSRLAAEASTRDSVLDLEALFRWKLTFGTMPSGVSGIQRRKSSRLYDNYVVSGVTVVQHDHTLCAYTQQPFPSRCYPGGARAVGPYLHGK